jgi:Predicted phosphohydrolases
MEEKKEKRKMKLWIKLLILFSVLVVGTLLYSRFIGTSGLYAKEYLVTNKNLPNEFYGLKIIHISDIHYGQTTNKKELETLVKRVNEYDPDIIVITGDLLDRDTTYSDTDILDIQNTLKKLDAKLGKYIIMGNHDTTQEIYTTVVDNSNLTNLDDTHEIIYNKGMNPILIAGMSSGEHGNKTPHAKVGDAIEDIQAKEIPYSILIMHEPDYIDDIEYDNFQLVLAGHSHNGQIRIPFIGATILPNHARKYYDNYYKLNNTEFYISSGVGTSTIKFRLFNRPSFNVYRLVNK